MLPYQCVRPLLVLKLSVYSSLCCPWCTGLPLCAPCLPVFGTLLHTLLKWLTIPQLTHVFTYTWHYHHWCDILQYLYFFIFSLSNHIFCFGASRSGSVLHFDFLHSRFSLRLSNIAFCDYCASILFTMTVLVHS